MKTEQSLRTSVKRFLYLSLLLIFLVGCQFLTPTPTTAPIPPAAPTPTPALAASPAATIENTALPVATDVPATLPPEATETAAPVVEAQPTLAAGLTEEGPWLLISASNGLWATNQDGSGLTRLTDLPIAGPYDLSKGVSPDGRMLAFVMGDTGTAGHLQLYLMSLPDGKIQRITALTNARTEPGPDAMPGDPPMEASRAMTDLDSSLEWSPDGSVLAFIGAQAGSSADLYTYTLDTGKVAHLTDGPSQAFRPSWSPLGTYIVHFGASTFGTGAGYAVTGAWAVPANGSAVIDLYKPPSGDQVLVGWLSDDDFVVYSWTPACGPQDLRVFHIPDKSEEQLVEGCFSGAAVALDGSVLVAAAGQDPQWKGVYRFAPGTLELSRISVDAAETAEFRPYSGDFVAGERVYSAEGTEMARAPENNCKFGMGLAAYGAIYAWTCSVGAAGVWINGPGLDERQIFSEPASNPTFAPDNTLLFFSGKDIYHAFFLDYTPEKVGVFEGEIRAQAWAVPQ